jgi:interleukin-1 receptor-associated kinase 1
MKFDFLTLQRLGQALYREKSPTDELLTLWGTHNHTILELFVLLSKMHHYQAMMILKPLGDYSITPTFSTSTSIKRCIPLTHSHFKVLQY